MIWSNRPLNPARWRVVTTRLIVDAGQSYTEVWWQHRYSGRLKKRILDGDHTYALSLADEQGEIVYAAKND